MYRIFFAAGAALLLTTECAMAQKGIEGLIGAEKAFAAYAVQQNTKDAFLHFMDSTTAVVFEEGKVNSAFAIWNKAVANTNKLIWQPAFAGIAKSGELGFTTGPWEFKRKLTDSSIAAGCFATIWHLNDKGEWKFLVDMGTDAGAHAYPVAAVKKWVGTTIDNNDARDALEIDRIFILQYIAKQNDAFKAVVSENSWFNLPGTGPAMGAQNIIASLPQIPAGLEFMPVGGGVSSSGDLAYVYGTVRYDTKIANYLRVWQKAGGKYNILLQVLQW